MLLMEDDTFWKVDDFKPDAEWCDAQTGHFRNLCEFILQLV